MLRSLCLLPAHAPRMDVGRRPGWRRDLRVVAAAWRTRPVTCSAKVGRTASSRAPIACDDDALRPADELVMVDHARMQRVALARLEPNSVAAPGLIYKDDQVALRQRSHSGLCARMSSASTRARACRPCAPGAAAAAPHLLPPR